MRLGGDLPLPQVDPGSCVVWPAAPLPVCWQGPGAKQKIMQQDRRNRMPTLSEVRLFRAPEAPHLPNCLVSSPREPCVPTPQQWGVGVLPYPAFTRVLGTDFSLSLCDRLFRLEVFISPAPSRTFYMYTAHGIGIHPSYILDPLVLWSCVLSWFRGTYTIVNNSSIWPVDTLGCLLLAVLRPRAVPQDSHSPRL